MVPSPPCWDFAKSGLNLRRSHAGCPNFCEFICEAALLHIVSLQSFMVSGSFSELWEEEEV